MSAMNEILPGLFLGSTEAANNLLLLQSQSITHILVSAMECKPSFPEQFHYLHLKLGDAVGSDLISSLPEALAFISAALEGGKILVHCFAGVSRSASLVVAYVMRTLRLTVQEAVTFVKTHRPCISPNPGFRLQLRLLEDELFPERAQYFTCISCRKQLFAPWLLHPHSSLLASDSVRLDELQDCKAWYLRKVMTGVEETEEGLRCGGCREVLGYRSWDGERCSCGRFVLPVIKILTEKCTPPAEYTVANS